MKTKSCMLLSVFLGVILLSVVAHTSPKSLAKGEMVVRTSLPPLCETIGEISAIGCKKNPRIRSLGCDDIKPPPYHWGGLKPYLPMGICMHVRRSSGDYVRLVGCMSPVREQYIILSTQDKDGKLKLLKTREEFRRFFAPIEDGPEALSYVSALTGSYPKEEFPEKNYYIRALDEGGDYTTKSLKPTEVWEKKDGFHVRLFDHKRCGCHRPELYEIEYVVTKDGSITEKKRRTIWQADRHYKICID